MEAVQQQWFIHTQDNNGHISLEMTTALTVGSHELRLHDQIQYLVISLGDNTLKLQILLSLARLVDYIVPH